MASPTRTILCGVDGSRHATRAAELAASLAAALGAEPVLAHVIRSRVRRPIAVGHHLAAVEPRDTEGAVQLMAKTAERVGLDGVRTRRIEARKASDGLLCAAKVERPSLIVVGARGRSPLEAALLGSVSAELPLRATCPVVVLPPDAPLPELRTSGDVQPTIVCGVVDSNDGQAAARVAGVLAHALGGRLRLVYSRMPAPPLGSGPFGRHGLAVSYEILVESERRVALGLLHRAARWAGCAEERVDVALEVGDAAERIEAVARKEGAALTVVGSRGRGPLRAAVLGSTSRTLASLAGRPVAIASKGSSIWSHSGSQPSDTACLSPGASSRNRAN